MSYRFPRSLLQHLPARLSRGSLVTGRMAVLLAVVAGVIGGAFQIIPVASQSVTLNAVLAPAPVDESDPWASAWDAAPKQDVPLSAQNVAPPFGGGTVGTITARAMHDGQRLFILLEWADDERDDTVNGVEEFADAAALQFPAGASGDLPLFTMGGPGGVVNIWHWKAVWQADIERGFETMQTRYPNTYVDDYPGGSDPLYRPAAYVGNPLAERDHDSPVENLIAEGFGTLTHADSQDVGGQGVWRDGRWRALLWRRLVTVDEGLASFAPGETTSVAFAVWDGGAGDRNGQKSYAPWIELTLEGGEAPVAAVAEEEGANSTLLILVFAAIVVAAVGAYLYAVRRSGQPAG